MQDEISRIFKNFGVEPDRLGRALVEHEDMKVVLQDAGDNGLVLYAAVGVLPENPAKQLIDFVLSANLPGGAGLPGRIGMDRASRILLYFMVIAEEQADFRTVSETLPLFTSTARPFLEEMDEYVSILGGSSSASLRGEVIGGAPMWRV